MYEMRLAEYEHGTTTSSWKPSYTVYTNDV